MMAHAATDEGTRAAIEGSPQLHHSAGGGGSNDDDGAAADAVHARRFIESFVLVETSAKPWGEPPDADTRHEPAFRHLRRALECVEQGDFRKKAECAALLRQYRLWRDNLNPLQADFVRLQALAKQRLVAMAAGWERDVYNAQALGEHLGGLTTGHSAAGGPCGD
jgi:hypothetical protein